jgi:hypothetical protein
MRDQGAMDAERYRPVICPLAFLPRSPIPDAVILSSTSGETFDA